MSEIPVIDLGNIGLARTDEPSQDDWVRIGGEIAKAFEDIGFVYLENHGIPKTVVSDVFSASKAFFNLAPKVKHRYNRGVTDIQGYTELDREKLTTGKNKIELRESYDVVSSQAMFPDEEVTSLRPSVSTLMKHCIDISKCLLNLMAVGLDIDASHFLTKHSRMFGGDNATCLRLLHYPAVSDQCKPGVIRCGQHTDYGTFTLLFQDSMGGLQVLNRKGDWIDADPIPGTILVNIGDLTQFWTSDRFKATEHRVLVPEDEIRQRCCRQSVVCFVHPDHETLITPLNASSKYVPITAKEHCERRFKSTFQY